MHITSSIWSDARFASLQEVMGWSRTHTLGLLVLFWHATRHKNAKQWLSEAEVMQHLSGSKPERQAAMHGMIDCGYLFAQGEFYEVPDNVVYFEQIEKLREAGRKGGAPKHKAFLAKAAAHKVVEPQDVKVTGLPLPVPETAIVPTTPNKPANLAAWQAYAAAYAERYGTPPIRNAKNNTQIANMVKRVGAEDAPAVLMFYVKHNDRFYVQKHHDLAYATRDAEGLLTQYRTGRVMTGNDAREHEDKDRMVAQVQRFTLAGQGG